MNASLDLHDVERDAPQQILQGGANPNTVTLEGLQPSSAHSFCKFCKELGFCEGPMPVFLVVCKEVTLLQGVVDLKVVS